MEEINVCLTLEVQKKGNKKYYHYFLNYGLIKVQITPQFKDNFNFKLLNQLVSKKVNKE